ncbi:TonB-dependent receptor [Mangrovibacterium diazotrophicum]|uniref:TonB-dependent receptor n=1 Tax=Mangrovibacterium diazotrophicum TaxID=1261403 RepID=A0A419W8I0_9BACT|nr:TonB-dependent receptor [Mangrovibacterium diazotrophicum]RKD91672.1 TonB-dependent receptor [Mangrovibacterium diazotrophicum]
MNSKFLMLIFAISLFLNQSIFATNEPEGDMPTDYGVIAGRVLDQDKLPLPGATVMIKSLNQGVVSDVNGFYRIVKLKEGTYDVTVSYIGFKEASQQVQVEVGKTSTANFYMEAGVDLNEVVVNGSLQGQSKALNQQKSSINVTNVISSDQVGRFPDANVGDALKRIPGISVQYDQGEARFGTIRGASPEYNSVTIDGDRIPSAEAETRAIQLDLVPSDMVQSIEVSKVVTADMDADAIGGSVNLVTKSNPYARRISGTIGATYNMLTDKPAENISLLYADRFFNNKLGMTLAGSRQNHKMGSDDLEAEWKDDDGNILMTEMQVRTYWIQRLRQSYSAAFDYEINPSNKIEAKVMYNHRNDWENRFRVVYKDLDEDEAKIEREVKAGTNKDARLEDQRTWHIALKGDHQLGALEMKWQGSYSKANEDRPNERYLNFAYKHVDFQQVLTDTKKPQVIINDADAQDFNANWGFDELTEEHQYTEDIDKAFKVDFKLPLAESSKSKVLRFGAKYKGKSKSRDNDFYAYEPTDEDAFVADAVAHTKVQTKSDYRAGNYIAGTFVTKEFVAGLNLENSADFDKEQDPEELAGNFDASEDVTAGYIRYDQTFGNLDVVAGVRLENTNLKYSGYAITLDEDGDFESLDKTEEEKSDYTNILPSLMFKYKFSKNSQLKAGWTNTIARPRYYDLVPHVETNNEDNEISIGNPDLSATTSMNFDLMFEHYYQSVGMFSAGIFYKDINDFIVESSMEDYQYLNNTWDKFTQPINAGDAKLYGIEAAYQRQFDFLPGFLKQMGFYANYTYTKSDVSNFQIEGHNEDDVTLPGTPENTLNASLYYEGNKLSARISFNYASDFVSEFGSETFEDIYYDKVTYLDVNASYAISKRFRIFAEANNLLNQPLRYYQGESKFTYQAEYYDVKLNFGLKFDL